MISQGLRARAGRLTAFWRARGGGWGKKVWQARNERDGDEAVLALLCIVVPRLSDVKYVKCTHASMLTDDMLPETVIALHLT